MAVAGIVLINLALLRQNRQLKERIRFSIFQEFDPQRRLETFGGVDLKGRFREIELGFSSRRFLLLQFSTGCPHSRQNMDGWLRLEAQARQRGWTTIWVSQDPQPRTAEFCRQFPIQSLVLAGLSCPDFNRLGLSFVPRTIAVDGTGKILKYWEGELRPHQWPEVFEYFTTARPEAAAASSAAR